MVQHYAKHAQGCSMLCKRILLVLRTTPGERVVLSCINAVVAAYTCTVALFFMNTHGHSVVQGGKSIFALQDPPCAFCSLVVSTSLPSFCSLLTWHQSHGASRSSMKCEHLSSQLCHCRLNGTQAAGAARLNLHINNVSSPIANRVVCWGWGPTYKLPNWQLRGVCNRQITVQNDIGDFGYQLGNHCTPTKIVTDTSDCKYSQLRWRVLATSTPSTCKFDCVYSRVCMFVCKYSRKFLSLMLVNFDAHVGNKLLTCAHSHSHLALACDIASHTSHSHLFVKLCLSSTVLQLEEMFPKKFISSRDGPVKSTETRQRCKHSRRLPYYGTMAEKRDKTTLQCICYTKEKSSRKTSLQVGMDLKTQEDYPTSAKIHSSHRIVFLCSFISALFLYF